MRLSLVFSSLLLNLISLSMVAGQDSTATQTKTDSLSLVAPSDSLQIPADSVAISDSVKSSAGLYKRPEPFVPIERREMAGWSLSSGTAMGTISEDILDAVGPFPVITAKDYGSLGQEGNRLYIHANIPVTEVDFNGLLLRDPIFGMLNPGLLPIDDFGTLAFPAGNPMSFGHLAVSPGLSMHPYTHEGSKPFSKITYRAGDWGYSDLAATLGILVSPGGDLTISGNHQELDGFTQNRNHKGSRVFINLRFQPWPRIRAEISSYFNKHKAQITAPIVPDGLPWVARLNHKETRSDHHLLLRVGHFLSQKSQLNVRLFASSLRHETFADSTRFNPKSSTYGIEAEDLIQAGPHTLAVGTHFKTDRLKSFELGDHNQQIVRSYLNYELGLSRHVVIASQVAAEKRSGHRMKLLPMAKFSYAGKDADMWLLWQRNVRYPGFAERYWPTVFFQGREDLQPEIYDIAEFGLKTKLLNRIELTGSVFADRTKDLIGNRLREDGLSFGPANLGSRTLTGSAITLKVDIAGIHFGTAGMMLFTTGSGDGAEIGVPRYRLHSYAESGRYLFDRYVFARLRLINRVFGPRDGAFYTSVESAFPEKIELQPDGVLDAKLTLEFTSATVFFAVENLLNRGYQLQPGFFMPIRTLRVGIEWEFWD